MGIEASRITHETRQTFTITESSLGALAYAWRCDKSPADIKEPSLKEQNDRALEELIETAEISGYNACSRGGGSDFEVSVLDTSEHDSVTIEARCRRDGCCQEGFTEVEEMIRLTVDDAHVAANETFQQIIESTER